MKISSEESAVLRSLQANGSPVPIDAVREAESSTLGAMAAKGWIELIDHVPEAPAVRMTIEGRRARETGRG